MKKFLPGLFLALSSLLSAQEPNIIVILVDDMGYGDINAYNPAAKTTTPRLDALAADGMRFTDFHTNSAVCTPTRYGLLTGRYAWRTRLKSGVLNGSSRRLIDPSRDTIPKLLKRKNYRTANVGKWHLGMTDADGLNNIYLTGTPADRQLGTNDVGFDEWYGIPASLDHIPYTVVNNGNLVNMTDDSPSPSYSTWPNQPASPSPRFIRAGKIAPGFDFEKLMGRLQVKMEDYITDHVANHSSRSFFIYNPLPAPHAPWVPDIDTTGLSPEQIYTAYIDQIDTYVGIILDRLEDPNNDGNTSDSITNNTLVIFTSDNGADSNKFNESSTFGYDINGSLRGQKADIHEGGHRVPFIAKWPGQIAPASVTDEPACMTDLFATFADIVDQDYDLDSGADSFSIKKVLLGQPFTSPIRGPIVHHSLDGMFAIREGDWKLIFGIGSGGFSGAAGEGSESVTDNTPQRLYNLATNPGEALAQNQLSTETAVVTDLHAKLDAIRDNARSAPHPDLEDDDGDGMNNGFETLHGLDKDDPNDATGDLDSDNLTNLHEFQLGTDPTNTDTDGDLLPDGREDANQNGTIDPGESNPTLRDTDNDGIDDLSENLFLTDATDDSSFPELNLGSEHTNLYHDLFQNNDPATGAIPAGGLTLVQNSVAAGHSLSETAGQLTINTGTGGNGNVGAATPAIAFANSSLGVRLSWQIASLTDRPRSNGLFLGVSEGTNFYRTEANIGLVFFGKSTTDSVNGFSLVLNDSDNPSGPILSNGADLDLDSLIDGFSATLDLTPTGWSYSITGLDDASGLPETFSESGTWLDAGQPSTFYSDFFGSDERMLTSLQRSTSSVSMVLDQIKIEALAPEPFKMIYATDLSATPSSIALVWNANLGQTYRIEKSSSLQPGSWTPVEENISSSHARASFVYQGTDIPPSPTSQQKLFFRVAKE
ncbi:MAG: sulfatase-like hydrolase/transferase [Verrucomicrobiaceae bacterium]